MNLAKVSALILSLTYVCGFTTSPPNRKKTLRPQVVASVDDVKTDPLSYDGRIVTVEGWLASGEFGASLFDKARRSSIRLRSADEVNDKRLKIHACG